MEISLATLAQYGYVLVVALVFLESIGFPLPAAIVLIIAGAAAAQGTLDPALVLAGAISAALVGDILMFVLGRYTGWWLLGILCRISLNPESCILGSANAFYRRGRALLLIAKFVPGINTMAPPLAGCMNMRFWPFVRLDFTGIVLYISVYFGIGYVFNEALEFITQGYETVGRMAGVLVIMLVAVYVALVIWRWVKARALRSVPLVSPAVAARAAAEGASIYDVRSHGYLDAKAVRIQGSQRLDPHTLKQRDYAFPAQQTVYVYCTCVREATSLRVARELEQMGVNVAVIKGGLRSWRKAGLPVEAVPAAELAALPVFR